jgi:hypothetical protein
MGAVLLEELEVRHDQLETTSQSCQPLSICRPAGLPPHGHTTTLQNGSCVMKRTGVHAVWRPEGQGGNGLNLISESPMRLAAEEPVTTEHDETSLQGVLRAWNVLHRQRTAPAHVTGRTFNIPSHKCLGKVSILGDNHFPLRCRKWARSQADANSTRISSPLGHKALGSQPSTFAWLPRSLLENRLV